jgi:hypothetical protein
MVGEISFFYQLYSRHVQGYSIFTVEFPRKLNVMQHNILKAQIARYHF